MRTADVLKRFGTRTAIAKFLGLTKASVGKWKELVPPFQASRLHKLTRGELVYDPDDYPIGGGKGPNGYSSPTIKQINSNQTDWVDTSSRE